MLYKTNGFIIDASSEPLDLSLGSSLSVDSLDAKLFCLEHQGQLCTTAN